MSKALRKVTGIAQKNNCAILFINQLREKVGVMFGNPETTTGKQDCPFRKLSHLRNKTAELSWNPKPDRQGNQNRRLSKTVRGNA